MDRDGRGHMLNGMVLIPHKLHRDLSKGQRGQRAYAHRDGAHTLRIPQTFTEWSATAGGHMLTGMVLTPYEFH